jgi:L-rhamnose mutarotase
MWSKALTYQLKPGRYVEYKKAHDEVWPELAQAMTDNQVNMVIHHREERLYLYMTAPTEEHFVRSHTGSVADRWLEYVATMMITDDDGKTIMEEMDMAFVFGKYKDELDE